MSEVILLASFQVISTVNSKRRPRRLQTAGSSRLRTFFLTVVFAFTSDSQFSVLMTKYYSGHPNVCYFRPQATQALSLIVNSSDTLCWETPFSPKFANISF